MTNDLSTSIKASRTRVPRSRGAVSGVLLLLLGAWAALIPFVGPYFNFAFTPAPNSAFHFTNARGWLEVLPGAVAAFGGLLLLMSRSRVTTSLGAWLGIAGGAWLIVGPSLTPLIKLTLGQPDPSSTKTVRVLEALLFFYAIGAAILAIASVALGRLSVHSVRDVRAAEKRVAAEEAAEAERRDAEARRLADERRRDDERDGHPVAAGAVGAGAGAAVMHERDQRDGQSDVNPHHDRDGDGIDDRAERQNDGHPVAAGAAGAGAGAAAGAAATHHRDQRNDGESPGDRRHDRDGDGVDDRVEGQQDHQQHDEHSGGIGSRIAGVFHRDHDRDGDGVDDRAEAAGTQGQPPQDPPQGARQAPAGYGEPGYPQQGQPQQGSPQQGFPQQGQLPQDPQQGGPQHPDPRTQQLPRQGFEQAPPEQQTPQQRSR